MPEIPLPAAKKQNVGTRYAKLTPADVQRVSKLYFHPDNMVEVRTGPKN